MLQFIKSLKSSVFFAIALLMSASPVCSAEAKAPKNSIKVSIVDETAIVVPVRDDADFALVTAQIAPRWEMPKGHNPHDPESQRYRQLKNNLEILTELFVDVGFYIEDLKEEAKKHSGVHKDAENLPLVLAVEVFRTHIAIAWAAETKRIQEVATVTELRRILETDLGVKLPDTKLNFLFENKKGK